MSRPRIPSLTAVVLAGFACSGCAPTASFEQSERGFEATASTGYWWVVLIGVAVALTVVFVVEAVRRGPEGRNRTSWLWLIGAVAVFLLPAIPLSQYPTDTSVTVDAAEAVVTVEQNYFLKDSTVETYAPGSVRGVHYHYRPGRGEDRPQGTVYLDLSSGERVEIFKGNPEPASMLSAAIASVAQVPLTES